MTVIRLLLAVSWFQEDGLQNTGSEADNIYVSLRHLARLRVAIASVSSAPEKDYLTLPSGMW
jgi:hypothetical protein